MLPLKTSNCSELENPLGLLLLVIVKTELAEEIPCPYFPLQVYASLKRKSLKLLDEVIPATTEDGLNSPRVSFNDNIALLPVVPPCPPREPSMSNMSPKEVEPPLRPGFPLESFMY